MIRTQTRTGAPPKSSVRAEHAVKVYGTGDTAVTALDDVSIELPAGRFTAIMGPSGSGKSTLLHCLAGLDTLTAGQAFVGETELGALSDRQLTLLRRDRIGFVFQAFNLVPTLSALDNITLPMKLAGTAPDPDWLAAVIERVGLTGRLAHRPAELSGGQQQRVAVARALAARPQIVFADEPTGNLDSRSGSEVLELLRALGQTRAQARGMIRWESVIIAVFGTAGGVILGTFLGWAVVRSSSSAALGVFAAPPLQLVLFLVLGAVTGILAGLRPARRTARLNTISAITAA